MLNSRQRREFREALNEAFDYQAIQLLVSEYLDTTLENIVLEGALPNRISKLILWAIQNDKLADLLAAAVERRPRNPKIALLAEEIGLGSSGPRTVLPQALDMGRFAAIDGDWAAATDFAPSLRGAGIELQRVVRERADAIDPAEFPSKLLRRNRQVGRVVLPGSSGTGFLVGADLMLTNHHVVQPILDGEVSVQDVHCEFDYLEAADGTPVFTPRTVRLDRAKWNEGSSSQSTSDEVGGLPEPTVEECDYCLLRLDEPIGDEPAGRTTEDPGAEKRGWIQVTDPPPFVAKGQELFVLQHPKGEALSLTIGRTLGFNKAGNRVRHDANTARGSSGSPCLNADLELVALHNAGDPDYDSDRRPEYNQAVPLTPILSLMKNDNVPVFWT